MSSKYKILLVIFAVVVSLDQVTKFLAVDRLTTVFEHYGKVSLAERVRAFYTYENLDNDPYSPVRKDFRKPPVVVVENYWHHKYVENPGAAWGLLSDADERFRIPFFHVVSLAAILFIVAFFRRLEPDQKLLTVALSLVLGGAVGNYIDRLARNYVVDFIDWHWRNQPGMHWPTFNVADAAICVGVALMLIETLFFAREVQPAEVSPSVTQPDELPLATASAAAYLPVADGSAVPLEQGESPVAPEVAEHPEPAVTGINRAAASGGTES